MEFNNFNCVILKITIHNTTQSSKRNEFRANIPTTGMVDYCFELDVSHLDVRKEYLCIQGTKLINSDIIYQLY